MGTYGPETYGEQIAPIYDAWYPTVDPAMVGALAELAGPGPALELGIGTGRVALPLQAHGVEVHGIDASPAMVARLREKPGGDRIPVQFGDFAEVRPEERYSLIYVPFNTFFALLTQEAQVACFRNMAAALAEGGVFAMEVFVPDLTRFNRGQNFTVVDVGPAAVQLDATQHDPVTQTSRTQHILLTDGGVKLFPVQVRYAWPAELDLMAQLAGLKLLHRWESWDRRPFTAQSQRHVSIYGRG